MRSMSNAKNGQTALSEREWKSVRDGFAKNYRVARDKAGLKHRDVTDQLGLHVSASFRWAYRETIPSVRDLYALARVLGCKTRDLLP